MATQAEIYVLIHERRDMDIDCVEDYIQAKIPLREYNAAEGGCSWLFEMSDGSCVHSTNAWTCAYEDEALFVAECLRQGESSASGVIRGEDEGLQDWYERWSYANAVGYGWVEAEVDASEGE